MICWRLPLVLSCLPRSEHLEITHNSPQPLSSQLNLWLGCRLLSRARAGSWPSLHLSVHLFSNSQLGRQLWDVSVTGRWARSVSVSSPSWSLLPQPYLPVFTASFTLVRRNASIFIQQAPCISIHLEHALKLSTSYLLELYFNMNPELAHLKKWSPTI